MRFRGFRTADGWLDVLLTSEGEFSVPASSQAADLAAAVGSEVEAVEGDSDPRSGELVAVPAPPTAANPDDVLRDAIGQASTLAELKAALTGEAAVRVAGRPA